MREIRRSREKKNIREVFIGKTVGEAINVENRLGGVKGEKL